MAGRRSEALEWTTEDNLTRIKGWARDGLTDKDIAEKKIGISERTFCRWKNEYSAIMSALKEGKAPVDVKVENALLKRALGYEYEEKITEVRKIPYVDKNGKVQEMEETHIKKIVKHIAPDVVAQIFWLKNRKPDYWKDKRETTDTNAVEKLDRILDGLETIAKTE